MEGPSFGERYRSWRKAKGVSNYRVEKLTGYSRANLSHIERGTVQPSDDLLDLLASVPELGLTRQELESWRVASQTSAEVIKAAAQVVSIQPDSTRHGHTADDADLDLSDLTEESVLDWLLTLPDEKVQALFDEARRRAGSHE